MKTFSVGNFFIFFSLSMFFLDSCSYSPHETTSSSLAGKIARGDYLVNTVCNCMHCHGGRDFTKFSGPITPGTEGKGGKYEGHGLYTANITPSVLGNWTDDEIIRAITTGITRAGDTLYPLMPYRCYQYLSKDDAISIVAYLRTLKSIPDSVPKRDLSSLPAGTLAYLYRILYLNDVEKINIQKPVDEKIAKGAYLVKIGNCSGCHSVYNGKLRAYYRDSLLSGGMQFNHPEDNIRVRAANLTPDSATGIGTWTEETFLAKFKTYREPKAYGYNPGKYNTVMPWAILAKMTDDDIKNIYSYLRSVKAINHRVDKWPQ